MFITLMAFAPAIVFASLVDFQNPGPNHRSAEDDAILAINIPAIVLGVFDDNTISYLKYISNGGFRGRKPAYDTLAAHQAEMARYLLSIIRMRKPLPKDQMLLVSADLAKLGYASQVRTAMKSTHNIKDDKKLAETMSKKTSADFSRDFCATQHAYANALFDAERNSFTLAKKELLDKLKLDFDASALPNIFMTLTSHSKIIRGIVEKGLGTDEVFVRNAGSNAAQRSNWEYVKDHVQVEDPGRLARKQIGKGLSAIGGELKKAGEYVETKTGFVGAVHGKYDAAENYLAEKISSLSCFNKQIIV